MYATSTRRAPTAVAPLRGSAPGRAVVGGQAPGRRREGQAAQLGQRPGPAAGKGPVEEARHPQFRAQPAGEPVALGHRRGEVSGCPAAGLIGDERHHVEHPEAGVGPGVPPQVQVGDGRGGERTGRVGHQIRGAGERQDRPVVVRITVLVEQGRPGGDGQVAEGRLVAALADVDHALEEHGASVACGTVGRGRAAGRAAAA